MTIRVNEASLEPGAVARLAAVGRTQLQAFLEPASAEALYVELDAITAWDLALTGPQGPTAIDAAELTTLSAARRARIMETLRRQARAGFSFVYQRRDVVPGETPVAADFGRWIQSAEFLKRMHRLTGDSELTRADGHASLYAPGHFLRTHDDTYSGKNRRFAYVLNLSRGWQPDWGGLLHFVDPAGRPVECFAPDFNSLAIFRVPQDHFVSQVASYARGKRYAITGWLFAG